MELALFVLLAGSFLVAGVAKLRDPRGVRATLSALRLPRFAAAALPVFEIALALALLAGAGRAAPAVALVVLAAFTLTWRRLGSVPCRCFGAGSDGGPRTGMA